MDDVLKLERSIGGGWIADSVQLNRPFSSIGLLTLLRGPERAYARLDLDKKWFIDALPEGINPKSSEDLVTKVLENRQRIQLLIRFVAR